jgi:glutamate-1-semialdehyde 2,1-aminomutase
MTAPISPRTMTRSLALAERAREVMPGPHSNLPGYELFRPIWLTHGRGSKLWDVDGNEYLDFMCGLGAGMLGYGDRALIEPVKAQLDRMPHLDAARRHPEEVELAEKIVRHVPSAEKVRYLLSGTEAIQLVLRLARAHTGRNLFIRFDGHYHGWLDNVFGGSVDPDPQGPPYALYREGDLFLSSGRDTASERQSYKLPWNDIDALERTLAQYGDQVALVLMEGINANGGSCWPRPGYLERVRELCDQYGIVFCIDEVITGFRVDIGGAQRLLGVTPDLTTFGKGVAGGIPISMVAGSAEIMDLCADRRVIGAGTFNGYPLGVGAALATLTYLEQDDFGFYRRVAERQARFVAGLRELTSRRPEPWLIQDCPGVIMCYPAPVERAWNMGDWYPIADHALGERFREHLFDAGVLILFRGRWFFSGAVSDTDIDRTLEIVDECLARL